MLTKRLLPHIALALVVAQLLLMLVSWIVSAALPMGGVRSMLSGEGIRWFLGHYADVLATPLLVWILLLSMAYGCVTKGVSLHARSYRESRARIIALIFLLVFLCAVLLMTVVPHAVLLAADGSLWASPFSYSLVPLIALGLTMAGIVYGLVSARFTSLADIFDSLISGLRAAAPWLLLYVLLAQLYYSLLFVFA